MKNNFEIIIDLKNNKIDLCTELVDSKYGLKVENENLLFFSSGVIFNQNEIINDFGVADFLVAIQMLYKKKEKNFSEEFTGEYCGFLYDKSRNKIFIFSNITGSFPVFYYHENDKVLINTSLINLVKNLKSHNLSYSFDVTAAYTLLTFIGLLENQTLISEIRKLCGAEQINIDINENTFQVESVGQLENTATFKGSKKDAMAQLDFLFKKAVRLEFDADEKNSSKHFALLSGGLDSRMNLMYAHKMGYKIDKAVCYTHSDYWDEKIAVEISKDLNIPLQVVHLDGGDFLKNIDPLLEELYFSADYRIGAQSYFALKRSYENVHGFVHSGIMGDGVLGSYLGRREHESPINALPKLINNKIFLPKISDFYNELLLNYPNREMLLLKNRGFNNLVGGAYVTQQFSLQASPFTNREFLHFALSLPQKWRFRQDLYIQWINEYLPESTKYRWERTLLRPNAVWKTAFGDMVTFKLFSHFYRKVMFQPHKVTMSPYNHYFKTNRSIEEFFDQYFQNHIEIISDYPELKEDLNKIYKNGKLGDKTRVLSLLGSYKKLFK